MPLRASVDSVRSENSFLRVEFPFFSLPTQFGRKFSGAPDSYSKTGHWFRHSCPFFIRIIFASCRTFRIAFGLPRRNDGPGARAVAGSMREAAALVPRSINTTTFVASIFGSGEARRGSIPRSGAVTEEQRSQNRKATQPSGRRFFLAPTSLLTPYRPLKGMRVARASSGPKIPRRKRGRIYERGY